MGGKERKGGVKKTGRKELRMVMRKNRLLAIFSNVFVAEIRLECTE